MAVRYVGAEPASGLWAVAAGRLATVLLLLPGTAGAVVPLSPGRPDGASCHRGGPGKPSWPGRPEAGLGA
ncbi:hypothetical protein AB0L27_36705, partial [Streptomyces sp. NPDC052610]